MPTLLELLFVIDPVDEEVADALAAEDISVAWGPNYCTATAWVTSEPLAAHEVSATLRRHGVVVRRLSPIVVNAAAIADRCGVKASTVHEWTRQAEFPAPYLFVGAPAWLWNEVRRWVLARPKNKVDFSSEPDALPIAAVDSFNAALVVPRLWAPAECGLLWRGRWAALHIDVGRGSAAAESREGGPSSPSGTSKVSLDPAANSPGAARPRRNRRSHRDTGVLQ